MNIQFAVKDDEIFLIEVNPRAYRTVPFVSKPIGHPLGKYTTWLMLGQKMSDIGFHMKHRNLFQLRKQYFLSSVFLEQTLNWVLK